MRRSEQPKGGSAGLEQACRRIFPPLTAAALFAASLVASGHAEPLAEAAEHYRPIMVEEIDRSLAGARLLRERIAAGDLDGAKTTWIEARNGWERAEVFTSGFVPDLDREIDAWPNALLGFHAIEAKLFGAKRTDVQPETDALIFTSKIWTSKSIIFSSSRNGCSTASRGSPMRSARARRMAANRVSAALR